MAIASIEDARRNIGGMTAGPSQIAGDIEGDPMVIDMMTARQDNEAEEIERMREIVRMTDGGNTSPIEFDSNLAEFLPDTDLQNIARKLCDEIEADRSSHEQWRQSYADALQDLGFTRTADTADEVFKGASAVRSTLLGEAVIEFVGRTTSELLPADGPVKFKLALPEDTPEEVVDEYEKVVRELAKRMNTILTKEWPEYEDDAEEGFFGAALVGSSFKKVCVDPYLRRPSAMLVPVEDIIVPYDATSIYTARRVTHVIPTDLDVIHRGIEDGLYIEVDLVPRAEFERDDVALARDAIEGKSPQVSPTADKVRLYECHADIHVPGFDEGKIYGLPFIVTIDPESMQVLSLRRNWIEGDETYTRITHFTHQRFINGISGGFYGIGFLHLLGGLQKATTISMQAFLHSALMHNQPGGLRRKGANMEEVGSFHVNFGEYHPVRVYGEKIQDDFMPLPHSGPSQYLAQFVQQMTQDGRRLAATTDVQVGDGSNKGPVGTTLALLDAGSKVTRSVHKRLHRAQGRELQAIFNLLVDLGMIDPVPTDVNGDGIADLMPVSDPEISSNMHRLAQAQAELETAQSAPDIHDMHEAYRRFYAALGTRDVDRLLKAPDAIDPPEPMDPVTEFAAVLNGDPIMAYEQQPHAEHVDMHYRQLAGLASHKKILGQVEPLMLSHIAEHIAQMQIKSLQLAEQQGASVMDSPALAAIQGPDQPEPAEGQPSPIDIARLEMDGAKANAEIGKIEAQTTEITRKVELAEREATANLVAGQDKAAVDAITALSRGLD